MKVGARVGMNPFPVELLESKVLRGRGVAWYILPLPLPVLLIQKLVAHALLLRPDGLCLGRRSGVVTAP